MITPANGWVFITAKKEWHFLVSGNSLCRKVSLMTTGKVIQGDDDNPEKCPTCKEKLQAIIIAQEKAEVN